MRVVITPDYESVSKWAAHFVANKILEEFGVKTNNEINCSKNDH